MTIEFPCYVRFLGIARLSFLREREGDMLGAKNSDT